MIKKIIIIAGGFVSKRVVEKNIKKSDFIICADSGVNNLLKTNFKPNLVVGDFDSISNKAVKKFSKTKAIVFPKKKDKTDLELALIEALKLKPKEIIFLGCIGSRFDQSLSAIMLLSKISEKIVSKIVSDKNVFFTVAKSKTFTVQKKSIVSVIPLKKSSGISMKGVLYDVKNISLEIGSSRGISNVAEEKVVKISLKNGLLLVILT